MYSTIKDVSVLNRIAGLTNKLKNYVKRQAKRAQQWYYALKVAKEEELWYWGKMYCFPSLNTINMDSWATQSEMAKADKVLQVLSMNLQKLLDIFPSALLQDDTEKGLCWSITDEEGWSRLAQKTGKIIHVVHSDFDIFPESGSEEYGVFYPNGEIEIKVDSS